MAGNKRAYNGAMKKGATAAWDRQWVAAIREYQRALAEFPRDPTAHTALALALKESGRLDEALNEYRVARDLLPRDPAPLTQLAALEERLGQREQAVADNLSLADLYLSLKQTEKAIEAWRQAVALSPDRVDIREKMFSAFKDAGDDRSAAKELVGLAQARRKAGDIARAHILLQQALSFDPTNSQAKAALADLVGRQSSRESDAGDNPVEKARRTSLTRLAQSVFEEGPRWRRNAPPLPQGQQVDGEGLLASAIDAQTHGRSGEAIERYEQIVKSGHASPEIQFNLALLYKDTLRYEDAVALLKQTVNEPPLASASYFAAAECYRAQGKTDLASENFILAMQSVDLESIGRGEADEVIRIYESLAESYRSRGADANADKYLRTLVSFLSGKGWEDKVREVRRHLESVHDAATSVSLAEVFELAESERVIESLALTEEYIQQGHLVAATEEAMRAVELAPEYLPAHQRLAEILVKSGHSRQAREKFETLGESAEVRGEISKASSYYRQALALAPEDPTLRGKLIEALVGHGRLSEALDEILQLGGTWERAGQLQHAIDKYAEGLRLARRAGVNTPAASQLRHRLADAHMKARDWQSALEDFQEIRASEPGDERTQFYVIELEKRLGREQDAEHELDDLLGRNPNSPSKTRAILAALAHTFPKDVGLGLRLARADVSAGRKEKAVEELDALGDRLLNAGDREGAVLVIRQIIALDPPRVQDYRKVLGELGLTA